MRLLLYKFKGGKLFMGVEFDTPQRPTKKHLLVYDEITLEDFEWIMSTSLEKMKDTYNLQIDTDEHGNQKFTITPKFCTIG